MPRRDETKELLADPEFRRHLERMKAGEVKYYDVLPDKAGAKPASELKAAIEREGFGRNVDWSAVEKAVKGRKRSRRVNIHQGSNFDDFLKEEGLFEEVDRRAHEKSERGRRP